MEAVRKALTDAEEMTRWFPLEAGTNPDGSVWMSWGGDFKFVAFIIAGHLRHHAALLLQRYS